MGNKKIQNVQVSACESLIDFIKEVTVVSGTI